MSQAIVTTSSNSTINLLKQKDQRALFSDLFEKYGAAFYGEIQRHLYQQEVCEQALTHAYKQIWETLDQYDSTKGSLFMWCFSIVRKEIRKKKVDLLLKEIFACQTFHAHLPS